MLSSRWRSRWALSGAAALLALRLAHACVETYSVLPAASTFWLVPLDADPRSSPGPRAQRAHAHGLLYVDACNSSAGQPALSVHTAYGSSADLQVRGLQVVGEDDTRLSVPLVITPQPIQNAPTGPGIFQGRLSGVVALPSVRQDAAPADDVQPRGLRGASTHAASSAGVRVHALSMSSFQVGLQNLWFVHPVPGTAESSHGVEAWIMSGSITAVSNVSCQHGCALHSLLTGSEPCQCTCVDAVQAVDVQTVDNPLSTWPHSSRPKGGRANGAEPAGSAGGRALRDVALLADVPDSSQSSVAIDALLSLLLPLLLLCVLLLLLMPSLPQLATLLRTSRAVQKQGQMASLSSLGVAAAAATDDRKPAGLVLQDVTLWAPGRGRRKIKTARRPLALPVPAGESPAASSCPDNTNGPLDSRDPTAAAAVDGREAGLILRGVSGQVAAGEVLAVMGPSGSGKSSLLALICRQTQLLPAGSVASGRVEARFEGAAAEFDPNGDHMEAGAEASHEIVGDLTMGFVQQQDCLLPTLTVQESILFAIMLRAPVLASGLPDVAVLTATLLHELSLTRCSGQLVGGSSGVRGVSGGERRRVSIAQELAMRPAVLVLDEVTSGLDSFTALKLVSTLHDISRAEKCTVIMSVHQPSQAIFACFDRLLLLVAGVPVFCGHVDVLEDALAAAGAPRLPPVPMADFLLQVVHQTEPLTKLVDHARLSGTANGDDASWHAPRTTPVSVPWPYRLSVLVCRCLLDSWRRWGTHLVAYCVAGAYGLFCGGVFWQLENDETGVQNRRGVAFFSLVFFAFFSITSVDSLLHEQAVRRREVAVGYYPAHMYLAAKFILEAVLVRLVPVLLFAVPTYFMAGLQSSMPRFFLFCGLLAVFALTMQAQAMALVQWTRSAAFTMLVYVALVIVYMLFSGFMVNPASLPPGLAWLPFTSPMYHAYQAMTTSEFEGQSFRFDISGIGVAADVRGELILDVLGLEANQRRRDIGLAAVWMLGSMVLMLTSAWIRHKLRLGVCR